MPAVAPLAAVLIALLALLLLYALIVLGKVIAHIFPEKIGVSFASIHPRSWVEDGVRALQGAVKWIIGDVIRPAVNLFATPAIAVVHFAYGLVNMGVAISSEIAWLVDNGIPELAKRLEHLIAASVAAAEAKAARALDTVHALLHDAIAAARAYAAALVHDAVALLAGRIVAARHYALALANDVRHDLGLAVSSARHYAAALVATARADLGAAVADLAKTTAAADAAAVSLVKSTAAATLVAAEHYADTAVAAVGAGAGIVDIPAIEADLSGLIDDVGSLAGVLGTDLPQLGDLLKGLDLTGPLTATMALTDVLAVSRVATRYMRDCGVPNCRNLHQLGNELHDLLDALAGGAFMALLVALVSDPTGTAHFLHDDVGPLADGAIGAAKHLLGV